MGNAELNICGDFNNVQDEKLDNLIIKTLIIKNLMKTF